MKTLRDLIGKSPYDPTPASLAKEERTSRGISHRRHCKAVAIAFAAFLALALPASAQTSVAMVCAGTDCDTFTTIPPTNKFATVAEAITFANATPAITTVQIRSGIPPEPLPIPDILRAYTVEGLVNSGEAIVDVAVHGSGVGPVFTVAANGVTIQKLTITGGGTHGIHVMPGANGTVINQCWIHTNAAHGVSLEGDGVQVYNTALTDNGDAGINAATTLGTADIRHCSIIDNAAEGIDIGLSCSAEVRNTMIFRNGGSGIRAAVVAGLAASDYNYVVGNLFDFDVVTACVTCDFSGHPSATNPSVNLAPSGPGEWKGKILATSPGASPLIDNAQPVAATPDDLDGDARPVDLGGNVPGFGPFDIGADELDTSFTGISAWDFVSIAPNPVGMLQPGEMTVEIRFSSASSFGSSSDDKAVIVPEQLIAQADSGDTSFFTDPNVGDYTIPITLSDAGGNLWIGTNAEEIEHVKTSSVTGAFGGKVWFDGLGKLYLFMGGTDEPYTGSSDSDRAVVIDTTPPRMFAPYSPGGLQASAFLPVGGSNDTTVASDSYPNPPGFPAGWRPAVAMWPDSNGLIARNPTTEGPSGSGGAKIFLNVGAPPNAPSSLDLTVRVGFEDLPDPATPASLPAAVSAGGFPVALQGSGLLTFVDPVLQVLSGTAPADSEMPRWIIEDGGSALANPVAFSAEFIDDSSGPLFDRMTGEWKFTGIPQPFGGLGIHWQLRFAAIDAAGNITRQDMLLDPLHIWWMQEATVQLSPYYDTEIDHPSFSWDLRRQDEPGNAVPSQPVFAYRIWSTADGADKFDPYYPVNDVANLGTVGLVDGIDNAGWSLNYTSSKSLPYTWFSRAEGLIDSGYTNRWLVLEVIGADEAGNVEQYVPFNPGNKNWQRFKIPSAGTLQDTLITARFFHDDVNNVGSGDGEPDGDDRYFGPSKIVPLPVVGLFPDKPGSSVEALLDIDVLVDNPLDERAVRLELEEDGLSLYADELPVAIGEDRKSLALMVQTTGVILGDPERRVARNYVIRATTINLTSGNEDSTPANYYFTVAPSVEGFVENKTSPDDQPVKTIETN